VYSKLTTAAAIAGVIILAASGPDTFAQRGVTEPVPDDPIRTLVGRLDLERYKATIKGLTQFGDRRQGTDRNRAAVDWIEAQLKSYGCPTERLKYVYEPPPANPGGGQAPASQTRYYFSANSSFDGAVGRFSPCSDSQWVSGSSSSSRR